METRQSKRKSTAEWEVEDRSVFESGIFFSARQAIRRHATGGNVLIAATVLALVIANIPSLNHTYFSAGLYQRCPHGNILLHHRS